MKRLHSLGCCGVVVTVLAWVDASRLEAQTPAARGVVEPPVAYHVWGRLTKCGNWRRINSSTNLQEACRQAQEAQKKLRGEIRSVVVVTGTGKETAPTGEPTMYEVYQRSCKTYQLAGTYATFWEAFETALEVLSDGTYVEIVYHYKTR
jgi:hypothetical protein